MDDVLNHIEKAQKHLDRAIGSFQAKAGSPSKSYVGSMKEFHKLVRVGLSLRSVERKIRRQAK